MIFQILGVELKCSLEICNISVHTCICFVFEHNTKIVFIVFVFVFVFWTQTQTQTQRFFVCNCLNRPQIYFLAKEKKADH